MSFTEIGYWLDKGMSLKQAVEKTFKKFDVGLLNLFEGFNIEELMLFEIYSSKETLDRNTLINCLIPELDKSYNYLEKIFYKLKSRGLVRTEIKTLNRSTTTKVYLTDEGLMLVNTLKGRIKDLYRQKILKK